MNKLLTQSESAALAAAHAAKDKLSALAKSEFRKAVAAEMGLVHAHPGACLAAAFCAGVVFCAGAVALVQRLL